MLPLDVDVNAFWRVPLTGLVTHLMMSQPVNWSVCMVLPSPRACFAPRHSPQVHGLYHCRSGDLGAKWTNPVWDGWISDVNGKTQRQNSALKQRRPASTRLQPDLSPPAST
jgi:hypothetical protein